MTDLTQVLGKLNSILFVVSLLLTALLSLPLYGKNITTSLSPFLTILAAGTFIFGGSAKTAFDSLIFVFSTHPFDAGDRVIIEGYEGSYRIEEIKLYTTVLRSSGKLIYSPNGLFYLTKPY